MLIFIFGFMEGGGGGETTPNCNVFQCQFSAQFPLTLKYPISHTQTPNCSTVGQFFCEIAYDYFEGT